MSNDLGPEGLTLNGEPATEDEIFFMEGLAGDLLAAIPAEVTAQYFYESPSGSFAFITTVEYEEDEVDGSIAKVIVSSGSPEGVLLHLAVAYDNQVAISPASQSNFEDIYAVLEDLLALPDIKDEDDELFRYLREYVVCRIEGFIPTQMDLLPSVDPTDDFKYVGDVIRAQVAKNTTIAVRTKEWGLAFDLGHVLTIRSAEILGVDEEDDLPPLPKLQIEYEDRPKRTTYTYIRQQDGETRTDTLVKSKTDIDEMLDEQLQEEMYELLESVGGGIPGKHEVALLTGRLSEAVLADL